MKSVEVTEYSGRASLNEAVSGHMKLCLLSPEFVELHKPIQCKDYLQDAFWSERNKKEGSVYGFHWEPGRLSLDTDRHYLEVFAKDEESLYAPKGMENSLELLRAWDKKLGFKATGLMKVKNKPGYVFILSKAWFRQPMRISLMSLLIRVGIGYEGGDVIEYLKSLPKKLPYNEDREVVSASLKRAKKIWETGKFPKQTFEEFKYISSCHDGGGLRDYNRSEMDE